MNLQEYARILIMGFIENSDNLARYLIRESKKAEREYIDNEEFFEGLNKVIKLFHTDIDNQYYKREIEVLRFKSISEEKGQSIEDLEGQVYPKEYLCVDLPRVTGNLFSGDLPFNDVLFLESEISRAQKLISFESTKEELAKAIDVLNNFATKKNEAEKLDKQNETKSLEKSYSGDEEYFLDVKKILESHKKFNDILFDAMDFKDYLSCFDLNADPRHPKFKNNQGINFVYFLSMIENYKVNDKIALDRFGLKNYRSRKMTAKPDNVFVNQVRSILKL